MDLLFYVRRNKLESALNTLGCPEPLEQAWHTSLRESAQRALTVLGVTDRVPFVIRPDGEIDEATSNLLLLFSGEIPGRTTMESYGRHVFRLLQTIRQEGATIGSVTRKQMSDYKRRRNAEGIKPASWNAEASALKSFFDVVVDLAELREDNPCEQRNWSHVGASVAANEPDFITLAQFEQFRDQGLAFGPYALRNVAFSNMLLTSAMRLNEGNSFLKDELLTPEAVNRAKGRSIKYKVPPSSAKGSKERWVRISKSAYQSMRVYDESLRDNMVEKGLANGIYPEEPECFWLNQHNLPIGLAGWEHVFREASDRSGIKATPKTLRHTSAVYLLSRFLQFMLSAAADATEEAKAMQGRTPSQIYQSIFGDPLRKVQLYLGHARYETTFIYLDILGSHDQINDDALAVFDQVISAEEAFDVTF